MIQSVQFIIDLNGRKKGEQVTREFRSVFKLNGFNPDDDISSSYYNAVKNSEYELAALKD
jgi:hypothetical protein